MDSQAPLRLQRELKPKKESHHSTRN